MSSSTLAPPDTARAVLGLAQVCAGAVVRARVTDGTRTGWPAWHRPDLDAPAELGIGDGSVYDGDAGIGWALAHLAPALDLPELEPWARAALGPPSSRSARTTPGAGLLDGAAGVQVARAQGSSVLGNSILGTEVLGDNGRGALPRATAVAPHVDHLSGLSGLLLAHLSLGAPRRDTDEVAEALLAAGRARGEGWCYPGPDIGDGAEGTAVFAPLTGLAHGSSGVLLALAHWLAGGPRPDLARRARQRLRQNWDWESAWADPVLGWPDLREGPGAYPVLWCHGAAGIAATRLELLRLLEQGVDLGIPGDVLRAQAESAVLLCGRQVTATAGRARQLLEAHGPDPVRLDPDGSGLTLCHGLAGPLDVLATAAHRWDVPQHLTTARDAVLDVATFQGDDPSLWPTGQRTRGGYGLFQGLAGTALVLARVADPACAPSPSLFGVPVGGSG
ncbi:lanthionine synthetase LanC family protein [Serinicoccus sp. LYQ131]|uniref:lanthionine synthetase LanC family protein n=1 Tax=Serinicoccus sp. LYQ131 TaxID=3378797 RepID=UPI0038518416